jgi:quinol monooxygenase YgiN
MHRLLYLLLAIVLFPSGLGVQIHAQAPADTAVHAYAVSYVDVMPSARAAMVAALKQYRDMSRKEDGYVRFDLLEQVGWPGHFAIVETWKDQKAFDAHGMAAHVSRFQDTIRPIRVSGYDQRPYKTLVVGPTSAASNSDNVYVVAHVDTIGGPQAGGPELLRRLAETSRQDPGCLRFDIVQSTMRMNHFTVVEIWQSQKALDAHAAAPHTKQYRDVVQPITGSPLDERLYKAVE